MIRLLLISSSRVANSGWLDPFLGEIEAFLGPGIRRALFVPFALANHGSYHEKAKAKFATIRIALDSLHGHGDAMDKLERAQAVIVGGGNTFRLLATLQDRGFLELIGERARAGMPFVGWSAGSNLACPTIRTTNDMPIVEPKTLRALDLLPFQINPHFVDADPFSTHMGETREQRIEEFLEENDVPVLGLREGAFLRREGSSLLVGGVKGAKLFRPMRQPEEVAVGARLDHLLA